MDYQDAQWHISRQCSNAFIIKDDRNLTVATAVIGDDMADGSMTQTSLSMAMQNATLISSAPELLRRLMVHCKATLTTADGSPLTYDTWSLTASADEREKMRDSLRLIAKLRGKSAFGNDWQEALT